jgi:hypothetical protein
LQPAGRGYAQTVPEHQQEQTTVAGFVPVSLGGGNQSFNFGKNQVFSFIHHFVSCLGERAGQSRGKPRARFLTLDKIIHFV